MTNIFEKAAKQKLRFSTSKGLITSEDLFGLNLTWLNKVAMETNAIIKQTTQESFISEANHKDTENELRLEILKHVIASKIAAKDRAKSRAVKDAQKAELQELLADKKKEGLKSLSAEDIEKRLIELES
jgi:hypothetical protein